MRSVRPLAAKRVGRPAVSLALAAALLPVLLLAAQAHGQDSGSGLGDIQSLQPTPTPIPTMAPLPPLEPLPGEGTTSSNAGSTGSEPAKKASKPGTGIPPQILVVLGVGALVIVATVFVVLAVVIKQPVVINVTSRGGGGLGSEGPDPAEWIENSMVRMGRPPEGTLKILPGRFVLDDGDRQIELRIFRTSGAERVETTIGREAGQPYRHIQLKPLSVSARHAKFVFENGVYSIINYSRTNPTTVNGDPLPENASRRLVDEDRIEVGEVVFVYHEV